MKYSQKMLCLSIFGAGVIVSPASADVLAEYTFAGIPIEDSTDSEANSVASSMSVSGIAAGFSTIDNMYFQPLRTEDTQSESLSGTSYFTFTVTADEGYELDLTSLTFDFGGTNNQGSDVDYNYTLQTSVDGIGSGNPIVGSGSVTIGEVGNTITYEPESITLSGSSFQGLNTITFRVNPWTALDTTDTIRATNVVLNGTVAPIPESSTFALLMAAGAGLFVASRRRRTR